MATRTISTTGGNWNATTAWAEAAVPVNGDDIRATSTSGNLVVNVTTANLNSFDLTGYLGTISSSGGTIEIAPATGAGTVAFKFAGPTTTFAGSLVISPVSPAIVNFTTNGVAFSNLQCTGTGTINQMDDLNSLHLTVLAGTWNTNNHNYTAQLLNSNYGVSLSQCTFNAGSSYFICVAWTSDISGNGMTLTYSPGFTIDLRGSGTNSIITAANLTYYNLIFNNLGRNGNFADSGSSWNVMTVNPGCYAFFEAASGNINLNYIQANGASGISGAGSNPTLVSPSSHTSVVYNTTITTSKVSGGAFLAVNSVNGGGNSGWNFNAKFPNLAGTNGYLVPNSVITITQAVTNVDDALVNAGCPQCGTFLYNNPASGTKG